MSEQLPAFIDTALKTPKKHYAVVTVNHPALWQTRRTISAYAQPSIRKAVRGSNVLSFDNGASIQVFTQKSWAAWASQHDQYENVLEM